MELTLDLTKRYTYADYLTWLDDVRRELIDGIVSLMGAPLRIHAKVSRNVVRKLDDYLRNSNCTCEVYNAPFDVRIPHNGETEDDKIYTVVQPDICVICDLAKLDDRGCCGAPDMIIEILSPGTRKKDMHKKFVLYEQAGVREYWIANPKAKTVTVHILLQDGQYDDGEEYIMGEKAPVHIFGGYLIDLQDIFQE